MLRRIFPGLLLAIAPACLIASESGSSLELKHEYFWDKNKVWNHTPCFSLRLALDRKWSFGLEQELDIVTGASRRLGADKIGQFGDRELDVVSGASKIEQRYSENPSLTYSHAGLTASGSVYTSNENDYFSLSPAGSFSYDLFDRNMTIGVNYAEFYDKFKPQGAFAGLGGNKRIRSTGVTIAQSLTPLTLVAATGTFIKSWGYLGHPYNSPMTDSGQMMEERLPDHKTAGAVAGQIVQGYHLGDLLGSLNVDARRYQDTWGLTSTTVDSKLCQYFTEGAYIRFRYRYYTQTGAAFAKRDYTGNELYKTGDIRFFPFQSNLFGVKLSGPFPDAWATSAFLPDRWDVKFDYMFRNTHGDPVGDTPGQARYVTYQLYDPSETYTQGVIMVGLTYNL